MPKTVTGGPTEDVSAKADAVAQSIDADILFLSIDLTRAVALDVQRIVRARTVKRGTLAVIMATYGGDPDAAYRIARCFQANYEKIIFMVPGYCKSAGTLVALGADEIVLSDYGELGPLDVQIAKTDELGESDSGLVATTAIDQLRLESFAMYEKAFLDIKSRSGNQISFRTASEVACNLTVGLFGPIFAQIQAMNIGQVERANRIAWDYGQRLSSRRQNVKKGALARLTSAFSCHSFVIDRLEAEEYFVSIREPSEGEHELFEALGSVAIAPGYNRDLGFQNVIRYLSGSSTSKGAKSGTKSRNSGVRKRASAGTVARTVRSKAGRKSASNGSHRQFAISGNGSSRK